MTHEEFARLEEAMSFIKEHDEHRDIANGVQVIDDSLLNGILNTNEDAAPMAQDETEVSEAREQSAVHQHLSAALKQIKKEIETINSLRAIVKVNF